MKNLTNIIFLVEGKWFIKDFDWHRKYGPYDTKEEAEKEYERVKGALKEYCKYYL